MSNGSWWCVWFRWTNQTSMVSAPCRHFFGHRTLDTTPTDAARESPRNGSASAPRRSDEACDLSADLCDLCDLGFSSHVMPFIPRLRLKKPILPVDISVHALTREEIRGNQRNQWEHVRHRTMGDPDSNPASETVPKIRTWLHTAVQSGCSFIASSVELKHKEKADLPLFNTFHLNPNCWSIPVSHNTLQTALRMPSGLHFLEAATNSGELFSDWLTESFSKHPTVSRSDQLLLDRPRPWDLSDLSAVPSSKIPKYQGQDGPKEFLMTERDGKVKTHFHQQNAKATSQNARANSTETRMS